MSQSFIIYFIRLNPYQVKFYDNFIIKIGEKGRIAKFIAPGGKRKYWEMERYAQEKNLLAVEKEAKEKDKIIDDLSKQIRKFEEEKLDYHESQDKLAK